MAADNTSLGMFNLTGIPPAPRGIPQIEVTFDIDANGILNVSAKDLGTGSEQKITITASTKLSDEEKERMIRAAEQFAEQDRRKKEEIDVRNNADSLIYTAEKTKTDLGDKINAENITKIDTAVEALRQSLAGSDNDDIKTKTEALTKVLQDVGTVVYQQAAQQAQQTGQSQQTQSETQSSSGNENVVNADYTVVDEDKD